MRICICRRRTLLAGVAMVLLLAAAVPTGLHSIRTRQAFSPWGSSHTLVIDAGHGGFDGGAVSANGVTEQHINLSVARRVQALAGFFGVPTVMTRKDEQALDYQESGSVRKNKVADIQAREKIVRGTANPIFISIHLNKFPDAQYWGAQVFYSRNHAESQALAEQIQQTLTSGLERENKRKAKQAPGSVYLMKQLQCPAVIVECGFLSNPQEETLLQKESYQTQLALCICTGYLRELGTKEAKENV